MFGLGKKAPTLVVHHLNESRSQRVLWMLEELGVAYELAKHQRDPQTRLAPPELKAVHPLGKSPVIVDRGRVINESAAILDYLARRHGKGRMVPAYDTPAYDDYSMWLHYAEASAMLPLMLELYVRRLGEAGEPLRPRIKSEIANHLGYIDGHLAGRSWLVGDNLTAADVQMSFVLEVARAFGELEPYRNASAYLDRLHARPAYQRAVEKGGEYPLGR